MILAMQKKIGTDARFFVVEGLPIAEAPSNVAHLLDSVDGAVVLTDFATGEVSIELQRGGEVVGKVPFPAGD